MYAIKPNQTKPNQNLLVVHISLPSVIPIDLFEKLLDNI